MKKRADDIAAEGKTFAEVSELLGQLSGKSKTSWWRRRSQPFRLWVFASLVWAVAAVFYILVFDPFDVGNWQRADDRDYLKVVTVVSLPMIAGFIKAIYDKVVR